MAKLSGYNPSFLQPVKGNWQDNTHFVALNVGTDAFVTEREMNEMQWLQTDNLAKIVREITDSGIITIDESTNLKKCFPIINNDKDHLNSFTLTPFKSVVNGYVTHHQTFKRNDETDINMEVRLPNPPVGEFRHDFVYLEFWFKELKQNDTIPKYGYNTNEGMDYEILDSRIVEETSRRIQLQWTISHYEDYDNECCNGFLNVDGDPVTKIHPLAQTGYRAAGYYFKQSSWDKHLFVAGEGLLEKDQKIYTVDGYVYAIPLFWILRLNNSGYDMEHNPYGAVDYVDETSVCDRQDGKFANIIYDDQITDLRHLSCMGEKQYNKIYTTLTEYYTDNTKLKHKINRLTDDIKNLYGFLYNEGYTCSSIYDREVYGIEMFTQTGKTGGAMIDELDDNHMRYRKRKFYIGNNLKGMNYCIVPTFVDFDWEHKATVGDYYIDKQENRFYLYNTGAKNVEVSLSALLVDNEVVYSGEGVFSGMDGTIIEMPFTLDNSRYFVSIVPLDNSNGYTGEIFVKFVDKEVIVYNTGVNTNSIGIADYTSGNKFQWVIIDMQSTTWKNINYQVKRLNGPDGVTCASAEFGENYRIMLSTPIISTSSSIEEGSVGDIYADITEDNMITVYNTGAVGAYVQCFVLNEVNYKEYYDTIDVPVDITLPYIVMPTSVD